MKKQYRIYIGQYYGKSWVSKLIKWRTWSKISHTSAFLPDNEQLPDDKSVALGNDVIEMWRGKARKGPYKKGHKPNTKINILYIDCTKKQQDKFYLYLETLVNNKAKYDYFAILGFVTRKHIQAENKFICSEAVFEAFKFAGIRILERIESYKVSPAKIHISPILKDYMIVYT